MEEEGKRKRRGLHTSKNNREKSLGQNSPSAGLNPDEVVVTSFIIYLFFYTHKESRGVMHIN